MDDALLLDAVVDDALLLVDAIDPLEFCFDRATDPAEFCFERRVLLLLRLLALELPLPEKKDS